MLKPLADRVLVKVDEEEKKTKGGKRKGRALLNCTPCVRQYDILDNKWGASLCQKEYQTNDTRQNLRN